MTTPNAKPRAGEHMAVPNQVLMREIGYVQSQAAHHAREPWWGIWALNAPPR